MGLWSRIKHIASCAWTGIKRVFSKVGNAICGALTTVATAVAAVVPNPVVKTIATVAAVAIPVVAVGANVVKAITDKKEKDPETVVEDMLMSYDNAEEYYGDTTDEFVQQNVDREIYGKKEAKKLAKQRAAEKANEIKSKSKTSKNSNTDEIPYDSAESNMDAILNSNLGLDDDDEEESYIDNASNQLGGSLNVSAKFKEQYNRMNCDDLAAQCF